MYTCCFGSPNHGYPADHWGARNRDSRTCHAACVGEPRAEVERYSINLFFFYRSTSEYRSTSIEMKASLLCLLV